MSLNRSIINIYLVKNFFSIIYNILKSYIFSINKYIIYKHVKKLKNKNRMFSFNIDYNYNLKVYFENLLTKYNKIYQSKNQRFFFSNY